MVTTPQHDTPWDRHDTTASVWATGEGRVIDSADVRDRRRYRDAAAAMWAHAVSTPLAPGQAARLHIPVTLGVTCTNAEDLADTLYRLFGPVEALDVEDAENDPAWPTVFPDLRNRLHAREVAIETIDELHGDDEWPTYTHRTWHVTY